MPIVTIKNTSAKRLAKPKINNAAQNNSAKIAKINEVCEPIPKRLGNLFTIPE